MKASGQLYTWAALLHGNGLRYPLPIIGEVGSTVGLDTLRLPGIKLGYHKFYCSTVHFNLLNVIHQLMHFQYNNILV